MVTNTNTSSAPLWTAQEIATATNGKLSGDFAIRDVHIDSRAVGPGDLFVAIKGEYNDAHNFLEQAKDAGAAGFLVQENRDLANNYILVENSFDALWDLAKAARARSDAKSIAITGSVGKTGTKELLIKAFGALGNTSGTQGNLNNHFGLPLTLARLPQEADYAILEMGMSAPEEIRPLSKLGQPHVAIITAIAAAHSEFFDSIEGIALAKSEIFDGLLPNGTAILNQDDRHFDFLRMQLKTNRPDCSMLTFGSSEKSDARLLSSLFDPTKNAQVINACICGEDIEYSLAIHGKHWALNSLATLLAVKAVKGDVTKAAEALKQVRPLPGRGELSICQLPNGSNFTLIDESYNASPAAVEAAIKTLAQLAGKNRKILVLGDMRELGPESDAMHAGLAETVKENEIDLVFTSGRDSKALLEALPRSSTGCHRGTAIELIAFLQEAIQDGDFVLVKGSLGSKMAPLVSALKEA